VNKFAWFNEARFGMFIHWGIYSIPAQGEWTLWKDKIPVTEYNRYADQFLPPKEFSPEEWVILAKETGMKYAVLTTRHHDGYSLYNSKVNPFNTVNTAPKRDFVAEFVSACREHGLRVGLYYSIMNWQHKSTLTGPINDPEDWEEMVTETHEQLRELMTNYGKIDMLWYDGGVVPGGRDAAKHWRAEELNRMVRTLQPDIMINDRSELPEDFSTPEQEIVAPPAGRLWESCMTMNQSWGYTQKDNNYKSAEMILQCLIRCARYGGNLLLNIGPKADGSVPEQSINTLKEIGDWMKKNGESIYGSQRTAFTEANHVCGPVTQHGEKIYLHLNQMTNPVRIDGASHASEITCLETGASLPVAATRTNTLDIDGSPIPSSAVKPVIRVALNEMPKSQTNMLGGQFEIKLEAGAAPVLAVASAGRCKLPEGELLASGQLAAKATDGTTENRKPEDWCPGFTLPVYACAKTAGALDFAWKSSGIYTIKLGLIAYTSGKIRIALNGKTLAQEWQINNPGCPDTICIPYVMLSEGRINIQILDHADAGFYAMQLDPHWKKCPTENWLVVGPFATTFDSRQPGNSVLKEMKKIHGPENGFNPRAEYDGLCGKVHWADVASSAEDPCGEFDQSGVDFSRRCPAWGKGVCFARMVLVSDKKQTIEAAAYFDWWANLFLNGEKLKGYRLANEIASDGAEFSTYEAVTIKLDLNIGENEIFLKSHCGGLGSGFVFYLNQTDSVTIQPATLEEATC